jgi:aspartate ammonia-lyase
MSNTRKENDLLGEETLEDVYYGIHTLRAKRNFSFDDRTVSLKLIYAMTQIKKAAALAHRKLNDYSPLIADAIINACDKVLSGDFDTSFVTHPLQGGAGTSAHMNVNEVLANIALETLGYPKGRYDIVDPIREINLSQSTNDVFPTAMRIAAIYGLRSLADEYARLQSAFIIKEQAYESILRLGRTQYMDALPITMGQTFSAYASVSNRDRWRLYKSEERLRTINIGGTAIGTGMNADMQYIFMVTDLLQEITGLGLARSDNLIDATQNLDGFLEVSGLVKTAAASLMKIANDFRLLSSGPRGGLQELILPAHQAGSSIMPGKVNPVILESIVQICLKIMGNDQIVTQAVSQGVLELNAFGPLIIHSLLESIELLTQAALKFRTHVLDGLIVDEARCLELVMSSNALVTVLLPIIGYADASRIAKRALDEHRTLNDILLEEGQFSQEEITRFLNPRTLVSPGVAKRLP